MPKLRGIQVYGKKFGELFGTLIFFSQKEVAERLGISEQRITAIRKARVDGIEPENFRKLAEIAGVTPQELNERIGVTGSINGSRTHSAPASEAIKLAETVDEETWAEMMKARKAAKGVLRANIGKSKGEGKRK